MTKYHFNSATGKTGPCHATISCPFGIPLSDHFSSEDEARGAFEASMSKSLFKSVKNPRSRYIDPDLNDYLDTELLQKMIKEEFVTQSFHPDDPDLSVLCYSRTAQQTGTWNDVTKKARGLIVQSSSSDFRDGVVIQRPWEKFFTLSQIESGWALGDEENETSASNVMSLIDFNAPAEVTDKMDGNMGVLYLAPNGRPALSTKGSFRSEQALDYTKLLQKNEKMYHAAQDLLTSHPDTTFVFETVGIKEHEIVLSYDREDIAMIGAIRKDNGLYLSTSDFDDKWASKGLSVAEKMPAKTLGEAFALPNREGREGVVVRIMSDDPEKQMQIKIKQEDYLVMHKLRTNFSKKMVREVLRETKANMSDFVKVAETRDVLHFPEINDIVTKSFVGVADSARLEKERADMFSEAVLNRADKIVSAKNAIDSLPESAFEGQGAKGRYVATIKDVEDKEVKGYLLRFFDHKSRGNDLNNLDLSADMKRAAQDV